MMLCPFVISVILALGYDKLTAFAATFGSILVGMIGTTFGLIQMIYKDSIISINLFERMASGILDKIYIRLILYAIVGIERTTPTMSNMSQFIYSSLSIPVCVYDHDGRICLLNDAAEQFFNIKREDIIGEKLTC